MKGKQMQVRKTMRIMVREGHCISCNPALTAETWVDITHLHSYEA